MGAAGQKKWNTQEFPWPGTHSNKSLTPAFWLKTSELIKEVKKYSQYHTQTEADPTTET